MPGNTLYLIPTPLGKSKENLVLPDHTIRIIHQLDCFIVENVKTATSFLRWINHPLPDFKMTFRVLNKKTPEKEVFSFIRLLQNSDAGMLSEAGAPCVADPGANLVKMAHDAGYRVSPLTGPSSILLALMASGMNGQHFTFHGYLPIDQKMRVNKITDLEKESMMKNQTQIFMETPHRNMQLYNDILSACKPETQLCIASNLTMPDELIVSQPVYKWKEQTVPELQGKPSLFLIYSC